MSSCIINIIITMILFLYYQYQLNEININDKIMFKCLLKEAQFWSSQHMMDILSENGQESESW